jgi:DNA-directed RNA polymerase subunit RPC12/RpoP
MKALGYLGAGLLGLLGLIFILGSQGLWQRVLIGIILMGVAVLLGVLTRLKAPERRIIQHIDLSGDVEIEEMKCRQCGAALSRESVSLQGGALFIKCPYCGSTYQFEEAPKW